MKSLKSILIVLILNISSLNAIDLNKAFCGFTDVKVSSEYCVDIHFAKLMGIVNGYDDATYKPSLTINRAEFMKIALKSKEFSSWVTNQDFEVKSCDENNKLFSDVSSLDWYCPYINTAIEYGFIDGTKENFNPSQNITLAETLKVLLLIHGKNSSDSDPKSKIYDGEEEEVHTFNQEENEEIMYGDYNKVPREGWYFTYVNWAKKKNLSLFNKQDIDYENIDYETATIKREEILRMYREIEDVLTCNISSKAEQLILKKSEEKENYYTFLKEKTPNCFEKALYYTYIKNGKDILEKELDVIYKNKNSIAKAKSIFMGITSGAKTLFTLDATPLVENLLKEATDEETKLIVESIVRILKKSGALKLSNGMIGPGAVKVIEGIFGSIEWIADMSFEYALNDTKVKELGMHIADVFLQKYYEYGGDLKKLIDDNLVSNSNKLLILYRNNFIEKEYIGVNLNIDLTNKYIESIINIVNLKYKGEM